MTGTHSNGTMNKIICIGSHSRSTCKGKRAGRCDKGINI